MNNASIDKQDPIETSQKGDDVTATVKTVKKSLPFPKIKIDWQKIKQFKSKLIGWSLFVGAYLKDFYAKHKKMVLIGLAVLGGIILILIVLLFALGSHREHHEYGRNYSTSNTFSQVKVRPNPLNNQLSDIAAKLANIEQRLNQKRAYVDLDPIKQDLASVQNQVNQVASHSNVIISNEIKASTAQLKGQLITVEKELQVLSDAKHHHKMLKASSLPFSVMSVDNIQESEVVTVNYDHHIVPIDIGDAIAGWTLASASNVDQKAEFKNNNDDYVLINLNSLNLNQKGSE